MEYPDRGPAVYAAPLEEDLERLNRERPVPESLLRRDPPEIPRLTETELIRHYTRLSQMSYGVDQGPVPLGSCTMKYNPRVALELAFDDRVTGLHPHMPVEEVQGLLQMLYELQEWLAHITGMDGCILHPAAGAHGELAGTLTIRRYHGLLGRAGVKDEIIVPDSAHGTNPASAAMAGFRVVEIPTAEDGNVDMGALKAAVGERTAGLMITNPSTLGLFEEHILEIADLIHGVGGLLYYDGANLNGIMGYARPGDMGFDIAHLNVHKTFSAPHGGGGPGAGPVCAKAVPVGDTGLTLLDLLPGPRVVYDEDEGLYTIRWPGRHSVGLIRAYPFNTIPLIWAYIYILSMGPQGLRLATEAAVAKTNYFLSLMKGSKGYSLPYGKGRPRKHEAVLSAEPLRRETGVKADDVAKGLLDRGFYAPTIYFPLIVDEALMIEFTETETIENIEAYAEALKEIEEISKRNPQEPKKWPLKTSVGRIDQVYANHPRTMAPTWRVYLKRRQTG
ncbi:MAG: aminomethyl-transferring glycine dehydrogenase subunit GcvPB [Desulfurococcales archaeon]|nr:aminomethyl-transferring glycine dehydrogenase subunit GcvPB [Desulfurococcales archaeon]